MLATARNKCRIICIEITICPVCRWCIFRLSLSFTDFISFISEWFTSVPKFHKFFLLSRFQSFCMRSDFASISYHLIIGLKTTWLFHLGVPHRIVKQKVWSMSLCLSREFSFNANLKLNWNVINWNRQLVATDMFFFNYQGTELS